MSKFLALYRGPATPPGEMDPAEVQKVMAQWQTWMENAGSALVDPGEPCGARTALKDDGSTAEPSDQNGYSIVEAADLAAATRLFEKHPFLSEGKGRFAVEIFELIPM